jgi:outer membrane murein-binding lipoprotein Lpp
MLLRFTHLCLAAVLVAIAALAGCSEHQARFADATSAQIDRAYSASAGVDLM